MVNANSFWEGRSVLVTGAGGFVGSWLVEALINLKAHVIAQLHHPDPASRFYQANLYKHTSVVLGGIEDYSFLESVLNKYEVDTVFHLAAQAIVTVAQRSPLPTFETNIRGTYNLLEACRQLGGLVQRIVIASSDKAYGTHANLPYTEDMPLNGIHPYEVSKSCTDLIAQSYYHAYHLPTAIARCGNIYGGGDLNWSRIIPDTIRACLQQTPVQIRSNGTFVRDYIYVKDVVDAYLKLAEHLDHPDIQGQAFNFSPACPMSVLDLVGHIQKLMNCEGIKPVILNKAIGEIHSQYLDSSKAKRLLDWHPAYDIEQGLAETIKWYQDYLSASN